MDLEEVDRCPVCQTTTFQGALTCRDHTVTGNVFHVKHCQQCTLGITSPRPPQASSASYYQSSAYISHTNTSRSLFDSIYLTIRRFTLQWKYKLIKPYLRSQGILDVGCGTGAFLQHVHSQGHPVQGVEPSAQAIQFIDSTIPVSTSMANLPPGKKDVITLWHVLEHIYDLRQTVRDLKSRLAPGGALFIAVPNHESFDAQYYREHWAAYDVPRHLWHFNRKSMAELLQQEGLTITTVIPMKLDSFYVSLLSEGYRPNPPHKIFRIVSALWVGLKSNRAARSTGNYSSLIFVAQA